MVKEEERRQEDQEVQFKQYLFVHDPKLYNDVFARPAMIEEMGWDPDLDADMVSPINDDQMQEALIDMRRQGLIN